MPDYGGRSALYLRFVHLNEWERGPQSDSDKGNVDLG
jgi:hypothetical protein